MCYLCAMARHAPLGAINTRTARFMDARSPAHSNDASAGAGESVIIGSGQYRYRVLDQWAELPPGMSLYEGTSVCVDSKDNVYVFNRGAHPVIVFDRDGKFQRSWGEDIGFTRPHGASIGPDDALYLTDDQGHAVRKCTNDGKVLMTIGMPNKPAPRFSGEPFNLCTHTALSPKGEIYVSDGYQNARVHKYSPDGKLLRSWGEPGTAPGQFSLVHNIACDDDGWVYVADRENHRVQVFDSNGNYETQWNNLGRPCGLFVTRGTKPLGIIGELAPDNVASFSRDVPNLGPRVTIVDAAKGDVLAYVGTRPLGEEPGQFIAPHGIAMDSQGDIYVAEVSTTFWSTTFGSKPDHELRSLQKLVRVS
ncbi:MAG: peptidyl-alpha-hydroxyglycine alpha-amidating lyase family protein [Burkholderiales bacterium]